MDTMTTTTETSTMSPEAQANKAAFEARQAKRAKAASEAAALLGIQKQRNAERSAEVSLKLDAQGLEGKDRAAGRRNIERSERAAAARSVGKVQVTLDIGDDGKFSGVLCVVDKHGTRRFLTVSARLLSKQGFEAETIAMALERD